MRNYIKSLLGEEWVFRLRMIKKKLFNSAGEIEEIQNTEKSKLLYSSFIKNGDLCFDVGANMGDKVQPMLEMNARVIAIEPQESCQKFLRMKFKDKIIIVPKGLGSAEDVRDFYISDSNTISSFSKDWIDSVKKERFKDHNWNTVRKIEMTTLDRLIETYGRPAFIKIDVEGYELEVLKGLSNPIGMICFEYTVPEQTQKAIECIKIIQQINPYIECNYTSGAGMEFTLANWQEPGQFMSTIKSREFILSGLGDIYVRSITSIN